MFHDLDSLVVPLPLRLGDVTFPNVGCYFQVAYSFLHTLSGCAPALFCSSAALAHESFQCLGTSYVDTHLKGSERATVATCMNPVMCSSISDYFVVQYHHRHGWSSSLVQRHRGIPFHHPPGVSFPFSKSELLAIVARYHQPARSRPKHS